MVSIIMAMAENKVIGNNNDLPWDLPTDLKRFKRLTTGKTIIMGRKCYDSIPAKYRPLPNRLNVVVTRDVNFVAEGCEVRHDLHEAINEFNKPDEELFVIGGAQIYKETFPIADKIYLTEIIGEVDGDVVVEGLIESDWMFIAFEGHIKENGHVYRFVDYVSKEKFNKEWLRDQQKNQ